MEGIPRLCSRSLPPQDKRSRHCHGNLYREARYRLIRRHWVLLFAIAVHVAGRCASVCNLSFFRSGCSYHGKEGDHHCPLQVDVFPPFPASQLHPSLSIIRTSSANSGLRRLLSLRRVAQLREVDPESWKVVLMEGLEDIDVLAGQMLRQDREDGWGSNVSKCLQQARPALAQARGIRIRP